MWISIPRQMCGRSPLYLPSIWLVQVSKESVWFPVWPNKESRFPTWPAWPGYAGIILILALVRKALRHVQDPRQGRAATTSDSLCADWLDVLYTWNGALCTNANGRIVHPSPSGSGAQEQLARVRLLWVGTWICPHGLMTQHITGCQYKSSLLLFPTVNCPATMQLSNACEVKVLSQLIYANTSFILGS